MPNACASTSRNAGQSSSPRVRTGQVLRGRGHAACLPERAARRASAIASADPHVDHAARDRYCLPPWQPSRPSRRRGRQAGLVARQDLGPARTCCTPTASSCWRSASARPPPGPSSSTNRHLVPARDAALVVLAGGFLLTRAQPAAARRRRRGGGRASRSCRRRPDGVAGRRPGGRWSPRRSCTLLARSRGRLGVQGTRGDSMLVDLRDRLTAQGEMPALPEGWSAEVVLRSAGGASFSGDFLVATRSDDGQTLEVALVDVSGKGVDAGTRALLLSGAFGGLLGLGAARGVPARDQPLPAPPAVGGGLRDRRPRHDRPRVRRVHGVRGRAPAGRAVLGRLGPLAGQRGQRGTAARRLPGRQVRLASAAGWTAATRCCCSPTG